MRNVLVGIARNRREQVVLILFYVKWCVAFLGLIQQNQLDFSSILQLACSVFRLSADKQQHSSAPEARPSRLWYYTLLQQRKVINLGGYEKLHAHSKLSFSPVTLNSTH